MFLISLYGTPLAQRASYLALHSSLFGPAALLIMIILSLTALSLINLHKAQGVFPMAHTLTIAEPIWPMVQNLSFFPHRSNPLGSGGQLADEFYILVRAIWVECYRQISPRDFKSVVSSVAPYFSGTQQHDSQEFLVYLLDGLHEDLNRVRSQ